MQLPLIPVDRFQGFLICAARVASIFGTLPIFSSGQTPMRVRAGLSILLALTFFPVLAPYIPRVPFEPARLALLIGQEAMIGFMVGFIAQLIFTAVEFGGTVVGYQMGFAAANVFDPQTQRQNSLLSEFQNVFAILIFLVLDVDHLFLRAIISSYRLLPPGHLDLGGGAVPYLVKLTGDMFILGVKFSAPVLALLLISSLVLGIMARIFPQLNVFMLSYPLNIGLAFLVIGLTLNLAVSLLTREFNSLGERFNHLFQLL